MKTFILSLLFCSSNIFAGVFIKGVETQNDKTNHFNLSVEGEKMRREVVDQEGNQTITFFDSNNMYICMPKNKSCTQMKTSGSHSIFSTLSQIPGEFKITKYTISPLKKRSKVAGRTCQWVRTQMNVTSSIMGIETDSKMTLLDCFTRLGKNYVRACQNTAKKLADNTHFAKYRNTIRKACRFGISIKNKTTSTYSGMADSTVKSSNYAEKVRNRRFRASHFAPPSGYQITEIQMPFQSSKRDSKKKNKVNSKEKNDNESQQNNTNAKDAVKTGLDLFGF